MSRILALDIGTVRIGVSVSDPLGMFAQGIAVLNARRDWLSELEKIATNYENPTFLISLPKRTTGEEGPEAENIREKAAMLAERLPKAEIIFWDERFTTVIANQVLLEADVSRSGRKKSVDKIAATLLLQNYLDTKKNANCQKG